MTKWIFAVLVGFSLSAFALEDGVFYRTDTVANSAHLRAVSVNIEAPSFLRDSLGRCSATVISPDGLLLTAKHCVAGCFRRAVGQDGLPMHEGRFGASAGLEDVDPTRACDGLYKGRKTTFEIVAAGQASEILVMDSLPYSADTLALYRELRLKGFEESGDFAIVKTPLARGTECASSSFAPLTTGERVQSYGFPKRTKRGRLDSDGHSQFLSLGKILSGVAENPLARVSKFSLIDLQAMYDGLGLSFTTLDAEEGSSGGGVFDLDGHVVAIMDQLVGAPMDVDGFSVTRTPGTTRVLSLAQIHAVLLQTHGENEIAEMFRCAR